MCCIMHINNKGAPIATPFEIFETIVVYTCCPPSPDFTITHPNGGGGGGGNLNLFTPINGINNKHIHS